MAVFMHVVGFTFVLNIILSFGFPLAEGRPHKIIRDHENEVLKPDYLRLQELVDSRLETVFYNAFPNDKNYQERPGHSKKSNTCSRVRHVPSDVIDHGIYRFYKKYTEAYGIPIMSSDLVSDAALKRACYGVRFMFADNVETREAFYKGFGRLVVLSENEKLTSLPEYTSVLPKNYDSERSIGGTPSIPVVVISENQLDCRAPEDLLVRELAIGIMNIAMPRMERGRRFLNTLTEQYEWARSSGLWRDTVAILSPQTYLGEGVQSYLSVNKYADPPDGLHNNIAWRHSLQSYDPRLFNLILEMFPCGNSYQHDCRGAEGYQRLKVNCPLQIWPEEDM